MGRPDFTHATDIIAQSLTDLRVKPFWDTVIAVDQTIFVSDNTLTTVIDRTAEGIMYFGWVEIWDTGTTIDSVRFDITIDGAQNLVISDSDLDLLSINDRNMLLYLSYNPIDASKKIFTFRCGIIFRTSIKVEVLLQTGDNSQATLLKRFSFGETT